MLARLLREMRLRRVLALGAIPISNAQTHIVTPQDVALIRNNVTAHETATFQVYDSRFNDILGSNATIQLLITDSQNRPLFHEGGIYINTTPPSIYAVSNQFNTTSSSPSTNNKQIVITHAFPTPNATAANSWSYQVITPHPNVILANGGFGNGSNIIFTAQGSLTQPGGLISMSLPDSSANPVNSTFNYPTKTIINNYLGEPFNSLNDIFRSPKTGTLFFTDPPIGYAQSIRPLPSLPATVYSYKPGTTSIKPLTLDLINPNGVSLSPDEKTAYLTDTIGGTNVTLPRAIYAFDILNNSKGNVAALGSKRLFATPALGIPDGIKTDSVGNVYSCCGDGLNVWDDEGTLLGKIIVPNGCSNFAFGPNGHLYIFNEVRLFLATVSESVQPYSAYLSGS